MYITTSKKPSLETKNFSRKIAFFLGDYGDYENRGRKSIYDVIRRAKKLGHSEIFIVSEKNKKPRRISKLKVFGNSWKWEEEIEFEDYEESVNGIAKFVKDQVKGVKVMKKIRKIFDITESINDDFSRIRMKKDNLIFSYKNFFLKLKKVRIKEKEM